MSILYLLSELGKAPIKSIGVNAGMLGELHRNGVSVLNGVVVPSREVARLVNDSKEIQDVKDIISGCLRERRWGRSQPIFNPEKSILILTNNIFLKNLIVSLQNLDAERFMISPSIITHDPKVYSSLAVLSKYNVSLAEVVEILLESARSFWQLKSQLDDSTQHPYINERIRLALIVQPYEEIPAVITYTYDHTANSVYFEYAASIEQLRSGSGNIKKIVLGDDNQDLTALFIPTEYKVLFEQMRQIHNRIAQLFNVPIEICWVIKDNPEVAQIRVVKEEVREFAP